MRAVVIYLLSVFALMGELLYLLVCEPEGAMLRFGIAMVLWIAVYASLFSRTEATTAVVHRRRDPRPPGA